MACPHRYDVAAMVLDALQPHGSARLHAHLAGCAGCRDLLADFGPLSLLSALVRPREAPVWLFPPPPGDGTRIPRRDLPWND